MKDIAVIGIAGRFPGANDMNEFYQILRDGVCTAKVPDSARIMSTSLSPAKSYMPFSYLDDIDKFDHEFFGISRHEAENMDPHQRILLEITYHAFESTGFAMDTFRGSNTGVILSDFVSLYYELAKEFDPTLVTGNLSAFAAGRIARYFDLRGMAMMVDTTCSSSLVALHMACNEIRSGNAEMMVVGGASINLKPNETSATTFVDLLSDDGKTKAFSADAQGIGVGEGAACMLLKDLDKAIEDGNIIYAVVKGSAVNQDAQLSGSQTAPSRKAQAAVIKKAWELAGINPASVTYIEAHGTATKLGDPIEAEAIDQAFKMYTEENGFCSISSVKSNIGHTGNIAGIMSLCKVVLSLEHKQLFASVNYTSPNPFINFNKMAIKVTNQLQTWDTHRLPRIAGISSFGLMGTNCHAVLQEYPVTETKQQHGNLLFFLSAKSESALWNLIKALRKYTDGMIPEDLQNLSFTLNQGREHFGFRTAFYASTPEELKKQLDSGLIVSKVRNTAVRKIFLFSGALTIDESQLPEFHKNNPCLSPYIHECIDANPAKNLTRSQIDFMIQYAVYKAFEKVGLNSEDLLGWGTGNLVVEVLTGEKKLPDAMEECMNIQVETPPDFEKRLEKILMTYAQKSFVLFIEMGVEGIFSEGFRKFAAKQFKNRINVLSAASLNGNAFFSYLANLYMDGQNPDLGPLYSNISVSRIAIPGYPFERKRCWIREYGEVAGDRQLGKSDPSFIKCTEVVQETTETPGEAAADDEETDWTDTEIAVSDIWKAVLKRDSVGRNEDFFHLGGHSLLSARVISRIEKKFRVKLSFKDVYTYSTVESLAKGIDRLKSEQNLSYLLPEIESVGNVSKVSLSHAQKRLWLIEQLEKDSTSFLTYHAPYALSVKGALDTDKFRIAFDNVISRHEILRTIFIIEDGVPYQHIQSSINHRIVFTSFENEADPEAALQKLIREKTAEKFDLEKGPLLKTFIAKKSHNDFIILFIMHHIISDGWSMAVLMKEIMHAYNAGSANEYLPPLPFQYKDYTCWHNKLMESDFIETARNYWKEKMKGPLPVLKLPVDYPRTGIQSFSGKSWKFKIDGELGAHLQAFSKQQNASLFTTLVSLVSILLHKYTKSNDIIVGTPVAGRIKPELEQMIGFFVNTLAFRNKLSPDQKYLEFLEEVKQTTLEGLENQLFPFDMIVDEFVTERLSDRNPVFDVMVVLQNNAVENLSMHGIEVTMMNIANDVSFFDLMFSFWEVADGLDIEINYNTHLYQDSTIVLMGQHLVSLMKHVTEDPAKQIADIEMISAYEKNTPGKSRTISFKV